MTLNFTDKQKAVWKNTINDYHRWNISLGATRSGKTYLDYYKIPYRIRHAGKSGLILLLGNTKGTLQRNILDPLRDIWTDALVGNIGSDNKVMLFGRQCYALGADKINQVSKLQGAGLSYCYGDEITTWNPEVFNMLKSRLDKPGACFDGTCNPDNPNHWFKAFLDSDADIYQMAFQIDDNTFLDPFFVEQLKKEYEGTVYYDRFIIGRWKAAEGLIYRQFADNPTKYILSFESEADRRLYVADIDFASIGVDFGGNRSLTTFVATGIHRGFSRLTTLSDYHIEGRKGEIDPDRVNTEFIGFVQRLRQRYPDTPIRYCFADSEAQYLINGLRKAANAAVLGITFGDSAKYAITDRIYCTNSLLNTGRRFLMPECQLVKQGLENAAWDSKAAEKGEDVRLDNFSSDIDILDADEYSWERFMGHLLPNYRRK